ncbi:hypothetical protein [Streptomyces sp. CRN 30]|uniref:hypothetical protein n=1 Tax=Streptomyces sp. CRN 30 TaxID=3075613 RepID=UPI002A817AEB|nr:hypothetical protein [Streptomyces sp. CRN 30]
MSNFFRGAVVSVATVVLAACGTLAVASATPGPDTEAAASRTSYPPPGGEPIRFGPFSFPSDGQLSGGFAWDTSAGRGRY